MPENKIVNIKVKLKGVYFCITETKSLNYKGSGLDVIGYKIKTESDEVWFNKEQFNALFEIIK